MKITYNSLHHSAPSVAKQIRGRMITLQDVYPRLKCRPRRDPEPDSTRISNQERRIYLHPMRTTCTMQWRFNPFETNMRIRKEDRVLISNLDLQILESERERRISYFHEMTKMHTSITYGNVSFHEITNVTVWHTVAPIECAVRTAFFFWRRLAMDK